LDQDRKGFDLKEELAEDITAFDVIGGRIKADKNQTARFTVRISVIRPDKQKLTRDQVFIAARRAEGWNVYPVDLASANYSKGIEFLTKLTKSMAQATKDVNGGRYRNRSEALIAVEKALLSTVPEEMPFPRYMSRTTAAKP
jgi:hypothetical protein